MDGNNFMVMSLLLLLGVVLLGISIAFIRVYWFGKGLPPEMAAKRPGRRWLDSRKKGTAKQAPAKKGKSRR